MTAENSANNERNDFKLAKSCHVLVVEDDPINQHIINAILQRLGCVVENAGNGEQALVAASQQAFDMIFMDIQMPLMDGISATRELRNNEKYRLNAKTPVIALTAYALPGDASRWTEAGMNDHLAKPITLAALQQIYNKHAQK